MHKFAALRRVFHSGQTRSKLTTAEVPHQSSTSEPTRVTMRPRCSSMYDLGLPVPAPPLTEPIKAQVSPNPSSPAAFSRRLSRHSPHVNDSASSNDCEAPRAVPVVVPKRTIYFPVKPSLEDFEIVKTIGTGWRHVIALITLSAGSFGRVYLAKVKRRSEVPPLAVKRLIKASVVKQKQVEHVLSEKNILATVNHPLIVHMHTTFQNAKYLYIVMEYVEGGEFFTYLRRSKRLDNAAALFYAAHVTLIFEYLHPMDILYRDLKPENLLITRSGYLKLTDFGFAKVVESRTFTLCGTPEYIAPEVLLNKGHGKPVDWWTLGILIYEMLVGYPPFFDEDALGIYQKILTGKIVFPRFFDRGAKSLVKRLLTHDLSRRHGHVRDGVSDVREHPWFQDFDFAQLMAGRLQAPYRPRVKGMDDTSNFGDYDESPDQSTDTTTESFRHPDPFKDW